MASTSTSSSTRGGGSGGDSTSREPAHNSGGSSSGGRRRSQQQQKVQNRERVDSPVAASSSPWNVVRLCGYSRSKCGYCRGERAYVLKQSNPAGAAAKGVDRPESPPSSNVAPSSSSLSSLSTTTTKAKSTNKEDKEKEKDEEITRTNSSKSYGLLFNALRFDDYQQLLNTGWRRSGIHLYKPMNFRSCCPTLSIRLDVTEFCSSKKQRRVWKLVHETLVGRNVAAGGGEGGGGVRGDDGMGIRHDGTKEAESRRRGGGGKGDNAVSVDTKRDNDKKMRASAGVVLSAAKQILDDSGVLQKLNCVTYEGILETFLPQNREGKRSGDEIAILRGGGKVQEEEEVTTLWSIVTKDELQKLCTYKVHKTPPKQSKLHTKQGNKKVASTIIPPAKRERDNDIGRNRGDDGDDEIMPRTTKQKEKEGQFVFIMVYSTVCAAISGRSKNKIDKTLLSEHVSTYIHNRLLKNHSTSNNSDSTMMNVAHDRDKDDRGAFAVNDDEYNLSETDNRIRIIDVENHTKSGHINVYLEVCVEGEGTPDVEMKDPEKRSTSSKDAFMRDEGKCEREPVGSARMDYIADFIQRQEMRMSSIAKNVSFDRRMKNNGGSSSIGRGEGLVSLAARATAAVTQGGSENRVINVCPPYTLTVRSVPAHISVLDPMVHQLYATYQHAIHGDPDPFVLSDDNNRVGKDGDSGHDQEEEEDDTASIPGPDFDSVYYQYSAERRKAIRKAYTSFYRFLCESPLPHPTTEGSALHQIPSSQGTRGVVVTSSMQKSSQQQNTNDLFQTDEEGYDVHIPYGTYHQQYRINDKYLIAVGVVDILPRCLSSVYAFYDPELSTLLNLGKYTALREIEWTKRAMTHRPELRYYYLGYYIHSCQKMRYKAEYRPSELLCPTYNRWVDFEIAKKRLDTYSPIRHCCTLYADEDQGRGGGDHKNYRSLLGKDSAFASPPTDVQQRKKQGEDAEKARKCVEADSTMVGDDNMSPVIEGMKLEIGGVRNVVTLGMLTSHGRKILDPLVKEFVSEVGEDISSRCIIKLC